MLLLFIAILSILSYFKIPKEIFPISSLDAISITGSYMGASSEILNKLAVTKIEDELSSLSEAKKITTVIKTGYFNIEVELKSGEDSSRVIDDIKDIIAKVKVDFPSDMDEPTVKEITRSFPLVTLSISANKSKDELLEIAEEIKTKLLKISDLSEVFIWGDSDKELLITLDESKIDAYGLNKLQVVQAISQTSSIFPAGIIKDVGVHYYLSSQNGEKDIDKIESMILKISNKAIYLKDIATVEYTLSDALTLSHFNALPNISIGVNKGNSGDAISLVKEIKELLKDESQNYKDVSFDTYADTSIWIKNRFNTVVSNIIFGIFLLSIALFVFINIRIAFIVAIGIPTSFMIGLIFAQQFGYSLNMLSLLGVLLSLGMLVDEAIVVGENIYRHMEMGKDRVNAAIDGAIEMYPAVLTATATTIFAFLPILLMSGETGVFMRILPIMISILLLSSLLEAFFFLPLHAKHTLKVNKNREHIENFWDKNRDLYKNILSFLLRFRYFSLFGLIGAIIVLSYTLILSSKFEFMPNFDTTQVYISGSVGVGNSLEDTEKSVTKIEQILLDNFPLGKEVESISSVCGMKLDGKHLPQSEEFYFHIFVNLKERAPQNVFDKYINPYLSPKYDATNMSRVESAQVISTKMNNLLNKKLNLDRFDSLSVYVPGAGIVSYDIELALSSDSDKTLLEAIDKIESKLSSIDGVKNIANDRLFGNYELKFSLNRYAQELGFSEELLVSYLKPYYFKGSFSKMYDSSGVVEILFQSKNIDIKNSLDNFYISIPNSTKKVLLKDIVIFKEIPAQSQIFKENGKAITTITASLDENITSEDVYTKLTPLLNDLSKNVQIDIKGEEQENQKIKQEMSEAFIIALILIFIALIWMFDSIVKSLIILSTIPLSIFGVLVGNFIIGINLTMPGLIGIVGLAGVVVNDGIIMMDFIQKAKNLNELKEYAILRLRPILLTSITTILGLSTLMFFASGQSLILQPMAVSLGFGILFATILNLYYVPMLYRLIYLKE
jgi:multidrug efflux pump subunit AcrB